MRGSIRVGLSLVNPWTEQARVEDGSFLWYHAVGAGYDKPGDPAYVEAWGPLDGAEDFAVGLRLEVVDGKVEVVGVAGIAPRDRSSYVPARMVKRLRLGAMRDRIHREMQDPRLRYFPLGSLPREWHDALNVAPRTGRAKTPDAAYLDVAVPYDEAIQAGSRRPTADVADRLGWSQSATTSRVHQAHLRKLLEDPVKKGKPCGGLTDYGRRLLAAGPGVEVER